MRILGDYEPTEPRVFHAEPTEVPMRECPSCKRRIPKSVVLCPNCQRYLTH
jgi:predicted amidophosphoribosyltransferase